MAPRGSELRENPRERLDLSPSPFLSRNPFRNPDRRSMIVVQSLMQPFKGKRRSCVLNNFKSSMENLIVPMAEAFAFTAGIRKRTGGYWKVWPPYIILLTNFELGGGSLLRCGSVGKDEVLASEVSEMIVTLMKVDGSPEVKTTAALAEKAWKQGLRSQVQVWASGSGLGSMNDWATVPGPRLKERMENLASMESPHAEGKDEI